MAIMSHATDSDLPLLRRVPYFHSLPAQALAALAAAINKRRYDRGQIIFLEGEPCAGLHLITAGEVKIFKLSPQGREQILHRVGRGESFNDVAALDGDPNPASAAALAEAEIAVISHADIQRLVQAHPALAWALIESIAKRTRHLVAIIEDLSLRSVKERLARLLLAEAACTSATGPIERTQMMTQAEMAARLGTVREMIGRALRDLADARLIEFDRHRIIIVNRQELVALADGLRERGPCEKSP